MMIEVYRKVFLLFCFNSDSLLTTNQYLIIIVTIISLVLSTCWETDSSLIICFHLVLSRAKTGLAPEGQFCACLLSSSQS